MVSNMTLSDKFKTPFHLVYLCNTKTKMRDSWHYYSHKRDSVDV